MRFVRYNGGQIGVLRDGLVHDVTLVTGSHAGAWPPVNMVQLIKNFDALLPQIRAALTRLGVPIAEVRLEAPILWPNKLIAYPVNFVAHGEERNVTLRADTNGFFLKTEWIPVASSAVATGFLIVPVAMQVGRRYMDVCLFVLALQALVGIVGFWFHIRMNLFTPGTNLFERTIYGAPPMAPLLFPNLVALALIGLWELGRQTTEDSRASMFGRVLAYDCAATSSSAT